MENASKALLIAGAILLAILLISLGIMVYNNAKGTISDTNIDTEKVQAFNTKISQYCGNNKTATDMNSLMDAIASSNGAQRTQAVPHYIDVNTEGADGALLKRDIVVSTRTYKADGVRYDTFSDSHKYKATYVTGEDGYITKVTITNKD